MTKKDYELIARAIANTKAEIRGNYHNSNGAIIRMDAITMLESNVARKLYEANPKFDFDKFYHACNSYMVITEV